MCIVLDFIVAGIPTLLTLCYMIYSIVQLVFPRQRYSRGNISKFDDIDNLGLIMGSSVMAQSK